MEIKKLVPGLLLTTSIVVVSFVAYHYIHVGSVAVIALILGLIIAQVLNLPAATQPGIDFTETKILGYAVALMAFQMQLNQMMFSYWLLPVVVVIAGVAIFGARWLSKLSGFPSGGGFLIGVGQAICGVAAIGAIAPLLKSKAEESRMAIGVITALGAVGMLAIPLLAVALGFNDVETGILAGGTLQTVGQSVAGGFVISETAGEMATFVKMFRVLLLGPLVIITALVFRHTSEKLDTKKILPDYIILFLVFFIAVNVATISPELLNFIKTINTWLIAAVMAALGLQLNFRAASAQAPKALAIGGAVFVGQIILFLLYIYAQRIF